MAQQVPMINVGGNLPPEILQQQQALNRQQQMAQLLMQQGQQMPSGQMVSGRFVAPSFAQYLAPLAQTYVGQSLAEKGDKAQADLAKALRQQYASEMTQYQDLLRGKEQVFEQAGPTQAGGNIPNQTYRAGGNPESAYLFGSTAYNPVLQQLSAKKLTEGPQWKEASKLDAQGNTISGYVDMNASSPESTFRPFAMTKMGISPAEQIRLADEGIGIPAQFRGGVVGQPQGQPTSAYGANVQFTPNQAVGAPQGQPSGQPVNQSVNQPQTQASLQTKTQPFTLQRFGYDPFKGGDSPTDMSAKDVRAFKAEQNKPITGDAAKTVSGATNYIDSLNRYRDYMNTLTPQDLLNPQVRAQLETKHKQVLLTGKEANNLGVLNGGDERILNAVMPNYSDIMITKNTLNKVIDDQMQFGSGAIVAQYRTAEKAVPERLRKYVEIEPPKPTEQKGQPKATGAVARAMLNGESIVVRNGKWVNERTGEAVK
jgi:hypothetical protein